MILRRDHLAGGAVVIAGGLVYLAGGDLPFGTLASPGPGMLPTLSIGLMVLFALVILAQAGDSPPVHSIAWSDLPHAVRVVAIASLAIAAYQWAGFLLTISAMLFVLILVVERKGFVQAAVFSVGVSLATYVLFVQLLHAPLSRGLFGL